jgi:hypothetical protein
MQLGFNETDTLKSTSILLYSISGSIQKKNGRKQRQLKGAIKFWGKVAAFYSKFNQ